MLARGGFFEIKEFEVKGIGECFHTFELHPALVLFGNSKCVESLLEKSKETGISVNSLVEDDDVFMQSVLSFEKNLGFNLENLLTDSLLMDRAIALKWKESGKIGSMEEGAARFIAAWESMLPFYSIEGFVGSFGGKGSSESGILDLVEDLLPGIDTRTEKGKQIALCLASVVGRDFSDIEHAAEALKHIKGEKKFDEDWVLDLAKDLRNTEVKTNGEVTSFFNTIIRFHNWMGLRLKADDSLGDTFDSVCVPANTIATMLGNPDVMGIRDATSPKGIAAIRFMEENDDEGFAGRVISKAKELRNKLLEEKTRSLEDFAVIEPEDPFFPHSLVGGKAQGLKSLKEAVEVMGLNLNVPRFVVVSRIGLEKPELLSRKLGERDLGWVGIARSSAIGEDSHSNFAGVFESVEVNANTNVVSAIESVVRSFTGKEARLAKQQACIPEDALGGVVLQERVEGKGIVLFIRSMNSATLSFADTPSDAVNGKGQEFTGPLDSILKKAGLDGTKDDLIKLFDTFGPIDLELVQNERVHAVQMRRIAKASSTPEFPVQANRIEVSSITDLPPLLSEKKVIRVNEMLSPRREETLDFVLNNKKNIAGVESPDNETSHIVNFIRSLGIPFRNTR